VAYRSFSTETWQDPWFEPLSIKAKLLFIYLWTNDVCNQSGCYQISPRRVEFETSLKIQDVIQELRPKAEWFKEEQIVWVKSFFKRQCANEKFALAGIRSLYCIPKTIVEQWINHNLFLLKKYGIDTVSIPHKTEFDTLCESVTDTDTDTVPDTVPRQRRVVGVGFDEFWRAYPRKIGKQEAKRAWERHNGNRPPLDVIISKLEELKKTDQWTKQGGQFIPHPGTWLNRGGWDDNFDVEIKTTGREKWKELDEWTKTDLKN
jgi:hypothetical protein